MAWQHGSYWTGARDVGNNDTFVWVVTGEVLPDDSPLWKTGRPGQGSRNCVYIHKGDGKLYDSLCTWACGFVCQSV